VEHELERAGRFSCDAIDSCPSSNLGWLLDYRDSCSVLSGSEFLRSGTHAQVHAQVHEPQLNVPHFIFLNRSVPFMIVSYKLESVGTNRQ
jgi:hypothetical protein